MLTLAAALSGTFLATFIVYLFESFLMAAALSTPIPYPMDSGVYFVGIETALEAARSSWIVLTSAVLAYSIPIWILSGFIAFPLWQASL